MKLSLQIFAKKEDLSYFLVLVLRHNKANAVIFEESGGTVKIINQASENFQDSIETATDEQLLNVVDKTISKAESVLPGNVETQKTIFGLKENWIEDSKIKKEYLGKLKKISEELGLVPVGFLITTEAVAHFLAKEEGAPVSAVLAEIDKDYVSVSLIRAGKIIEVKSAKLEGSTTQTVDTLLKYFEDVEVLPSRVIIFNGEKDLTQEFIGHTWSKTLPFLHLPQISNLEQGFDAKAVLSGAASEMGFQILGETPKGTTSKITEKNTKESLSVEKTSTEISEDLPEEPFGFVKDRDVAKNIQQKTEAVEENMAVSNIIDEIPDQQQVIEERKPLSTNANEVLLGAISILPKLFKVLKNSFSKLPIISSISIPKGNKFIAIPALFLILFLLLLSVYLFGRNATVTLSLEGKKVSEEKDVVFSTSSSTDASKNIIAAEFVDVTENGSTTTNATGKKNIGTAAKGTVTIFNQNLSSINIPANSTITSSNNLKFIIDKSITVASASAKDQFSPTNPGTTNVTVTAADIGTNYNLPSNTKFSFSDSSIAAKNDNPFSGGTKKSITVVSKDDVAKLESDLIKNLEEKARNDVSKKASGDRVILPVFVSETLGKKDFDKKEGDETSKVTLKADVSYKSITYNKSDLISFAKTILQIQDSLIFDESRIATNAKNIKVKSGSEAGTTLEISGFLLPKIDEANLAKQISGKNITTAQNILTNISQISNANINISPNIPLFPKTLPTAGKIKFSINSNE